ncbi:MAG: MaoC family dehydratase [Chitinophagales bacterium]
MKVYKNLAELKADEGAILAPTDWIQVTQEMIDTFAKATLDFQWIHIDPERSKKESPFGTTIAHGFLSLSLMPEFMAKSMTVESAKMGVNYGLNKVRFPHHVPVGSKLRLQTKIAKVEPQGPNGVKIFWQSSIEIEGVKKPACVAELISLIFE